MSIDRDVAECGGDTEASALFMVFNRHLDGARGQDAMSTLEELTRRGVAKGRHWTKVLIVLLKASDSEGVGALLRKMHSAGVSPEEPIFNVMIDHCASNDADRYDEAIELGCLMHKEGLAMNARTFGALIRCCWNIKNGSCDRPARPEAAERWFRLYLDTLRTPAAEGADAGASDKAPPFTMSPPDPHVFSMFRRTYGIGVVNARKVALEYMLDFDACEAGKRQYMVSADFRSPRELLNDLHKCGNPDEEGGVNVARALEILQEMEDRNLAQSGSICYQAVLHAMAKSKQDHFDPAMRIVERMRLSIVRDMGTRLGSNRQVWFSPQTYGTIIRCCWGNRADTKPARPREAFHWMGVYLQSIREGHPQHNFIQHDTFNMFRQTTGIGYRRAREFCRERGFDYDRIIANKTGENHNRGKSFADKIRS
eukprot:g400.t1